MIINGEWTNNGTLNNYGTITGTGSIANNGTINNYSGQISVNVTGNGIVNMPSDVYVTFKDDQDGPIAKAYYGDNLKIVATALSKDLSALMAARRAAPQTVDFYLGDMAAGVKLGTADVKVAGGSVTAEFALTAEAWEKGFVLGKNTITADFGGAGWSCGQYWYGRVDCSCKSSASG